MLYAHQRARVWICPFFPRMHKNWVQHPMDARARTHVFPRTRTLVCVRHNTLTWVPSRGEPSPVALMAESS